MNTIINNKEVNMGSLQIEDVYTSDYPDFVDAYVSEGYFTDGSMMSEDELEQLDPCVAQELALESILD